MCRTPVLFCVLGLMVFGGCAPDDPRPAVQVQVEESVVGVAMDLELRTFVSLVDSARMRPDLLMPGPFTVFAPSDEAFAALRPEVLGALRRRENRSVLRDLLHYHIVEDSLPRSAILEVSSLTTMHGEVIRVTSIDDGLTLTDTQGNTARAREVPTGAANGVVYVLDGVLYHAPAAEVVDFDPQGPVAHAPPD